jgi:hypothetical protein
MGALTRWFRFSLLGIRLGKRVNKRVYEENEQDELFRDE